MCASAPSAPNPQSDACQTSSDFMLIALQSILGVDHACEDTNRCQKEYFIALICMSSGLWSLS